MQSKQEQPRPVDLRRIVESYCQWYQTIYQDEYCLGEKLLRGEESTRAMGEFRALHEFYTENQITFRQFEGHGPYAGKIYCPAHDYIEFCLRRFFHQGKRAPQPSWCADKLIWGQFRNRPLVPTQPYRVDCADLYTDLDPEVRAICGLG